MKFLRKILLVGLLPGFLISQAQNVQNKEDVPLDLGYRVLPMGDYNGSAYTISGKQLRNLPVTNLSAVLAGLVPGYFARQVQGGGLVNEQNSFWIRGQRSNSPDVLVLVDGQERDFAVLSSHEVESITVLKDAAATALYGMRAGSGAILVTTRKGAKGKPQVELTAQIIAQQPLKELKSLNAADYARQHNIARHNDNMDPLYSNYDIMNYAKNDPNSILYPNVDWANKYLKDIRWSQRYNLNIQGGTEKSTYFVNAMYTRNNGYFNTDDSHDYNTNHSAERFNIRSNIDFAVTRTTQLDVNLYGWYQSQNGPGSGAENIYKNLVTLPQGIFPEWYNDQGYTDQYGNVINAEDGKIVAGNAFRENPWAMLNRSGYFQDKQLYGSFRTKLSQDLSFITEGLKASVALSMDSRTISSIRRTITFAYYEKDATNENVLRRTREDDSMINKVDNTSSFRRTGIVAQLDYNRTFGKHGVSALAFYEQYESNDEMVLPTRFQSVNGWFGYNYDKRYGIDVIGAYQGSHKFGPGHKFGFFPTISAGWTVSNESFWKDAKKIVPYLKLKASYGQVGNSSGVDAFYYRGRMWPQNEVYITGVNMGTKLGGYIQDILPNPGLTWEKARILNIGIDTRLFSDRLSVTAEFFKDNRHDMYVVNNKISSLVGNVKEFKQNIGKINSHGVDLSAMWNSNIADWSYFIGGTFSYSTNELIANGEVDQPYEWLKNQGRPLGENRGYIAKGFFNSWEEIAASPVQTFSDVQPGDVRYEDINKDGQIDVNDMVPIGYGDIPRIMYGINLGVGYKGFSITALFQGAAKVSHQYSDIVMNPFTDNGTIFEHQLDYWTPEHQNATFPRLTTLDNASLNNRQISTLNVKDADFLRLKTLEVAYDFPTKMIQKIHLKGLRLFLSGTNLITWTKYKWVDPEAPSLAAPLTRNMSIGCSLKF